jgi:ankyrin repeat protein
MRKLFLAAAAVAALAPLPALAQAPAASPDTAARRPATPQEADALGAAAMRADVAAVKELLARGINPNTTGSLGKTPLRMATSLACSMPGASEANVTAIVDALITAGADVNHVDQFGLGDLLMAAQKCKAPVVKRMLEAGGDVEKRSPQGYTPLAMALIVQNYSAAGALVDHGARLSPQAMKKIFPEPPTDAEVAALVKKATGKPAPAAKK